MLVERMGLGPNGIAALKEKPVVPESGQTRVWHQLKAESASLGEAVMMRSENDIVTG